MDNGAWTGVHDLKLRNVEGNNRMQIVIGADSYYDGASRSIASIRITRSRGSGQTLRGRKAIHLTL